MPDDGVIVLLSEDFEDDGLLRIRGDKGIQGCKQLLFTGGGEVFAASGFDPSPGCG